MKNLIISTILVAVCTAGYAHTNQRLIGPKAKNTTIWEKDHNFKGIHTADQIDELGGKAKNKRHIYNSKKLTTNTINERIVIKGPKAKNQKMWEN